MRNDWEVTEYTIRVEHKRGTKPPTARIREFIEELDAATPDHTAVEAAETRPIRFMDGIRREDDDE